MQRRRFLKTMSAAPTALASSFVLRAGERFSFGHSDSDQEPQVFFYDDGRHASGLYQFQPPLIPADLNLAVDQLTDSGVDTLFYSAGLEGGVVQYDSQVADKWGDNVQEWSHPIFYRAARNLQQLIADGHDPMRFLSERCHQNRMYFLPTCPLGIVGGSRETDLGYGRKSDFVLDHPQFHVGEDPDPRAENMARFHTAKRLSFLHNQVRRERFLIFEELLTRYETDGVEVDLSIDNEFAPLCLLGEVAEYTAVLTQWIRDLRKVATEAAQSQQRRKRIYIRIPAASLSHWESLGFDVPSWISEELVDGLVCITENKKETRRDSVVFADQNLDLDAALQLTRGTACRVLAGFASPLGRQLESTATPSMIWGAAALSYRKGADGFGLCSGMWAPHGWPWGAREYSTLRLLGHPDLLQTANKTYLVPSQSKGSGQGGTLRDGRILLPRELDEGESLTARLSIADDLPRWSALGRVQSVRLWVRMTNYEPTLNKIEVRLNGIRLPESLRRGSDLHFHAIKNTFVGPYGFAFEYSLPKEFHPRQGENEVSVKLVKRDPKLKSPREVYDIALFIDYLPHRNFQKAPIPF
jgi:hypothetical protein